VRRRRPSTSPCLHAGNLLASHVEYRVPWGECTSHLQDYINSEVLGEAQALRERSSRAQLWAAVVPCEIFDTACT
jgi:hypothetical protein